MFFLSSAPSGEPWALFDPCTLGAPNPMVVRQAIMLGFSEALAFSKALEISS